MSVYWGRKPNEFNISFAFSPLSVCVILSCFIHVIVFISFIILSYCILPAALSLRCSVQIRVFVFVFCDAAARAGEWDRCLCSMLKCSVCQSVG